MREISPVESYIDGVVAYHQYRDFLDLKVPEARAHPDTLEVFDDLTELVATSDELRLAYTGVFKFRGAKKQDAIGTVRQIENDILSELHDLELITEARYAKTRGELQEDDGVKQVATNFIKLFKPVIPREEQPTVRRKKSKTTQAKQSVVTPLASPATDKVEAIQATRFVLEEDSAGNLRINNNPLDLGVTESALLDTLIDLAMEYPDAYVQADVLQQRARWRTMIERFKEQGKPVPRFSSVLSELRSSLKEFGLGNFLESDGMGRGRTYRVNIHLARTVDQFADKSKQVAVAPSPYFEKAEKPALIEDPVQEGDIDLDAVIFTERVLDHIRTIITDKESGRRLSDLRKNLERRLFIGNESVREVLRNLIRSSDLHVIGNDNGIRLVSTVAQQQEKDIDGASTNKRSEQESTDQMVFSEDERVLVRKLLSDLANTDVRRGVKVKGFWVEDSELEPIVRSAIQKLAKLGYVERYTPKLQSASHSRRNTEPFVRFTDADIWRTSKRDIGSLFDSLFTLVSN